MPIILGPEFPVKRGDSRRPPEQVGQWGPGYDCCIVCGRSDSKHSGYGECVRCRKRREYSETFHPDAAPDMGAMSQ